MQRVRLETNSITLLLSNNLDNAEEDELTKPVRVRACACMHAHARACACARARARSLPRALACATTRIILGVVAYAMTRPCCAGVYKRTEGSE